VASQGRVGEPCRLRGCHWAREAGWEHAGLYVVTLAPGESRLITGREFEWLVLPLSGQVRVECDGKLVFLFGREGPFAGPTDFAYVPVRSTFTLTSTAGARIACRTPRHQSRCRSGESPPRRRLSSCGAPGTVHVR